VKGPCQLTLCCHEKGLETRTQTEKLLSAENRQEPMTPTAIDTF
jgi:hypothetical protein